MISNMESEIHFKKEKANFFSFFHALFEHRIFDLIVFCLKNMFEIVNIYNVAIFSEFS